MLAFTAALAIATALLFGVGPAVRAVRGAAGNRTGTRTVTSRARPGKLLVCGQLAVSMILVTGAVLFLRTLHHLATADLGFRWDNVVSADLSFPRGAPAARSQAAFHQIAEQLSERGLIASWVWPGIYGHGGWTMTVHVQGEPPRGQDDEVRIVAVGPSFFEALGIGLEQGRYFNRADSGSAPGVVIVNHTFAIRLFGSRMPLGRGIVLARAAPREIVGVVRDVRHAGVRDPLEPVIYVPALQWPNSPGAALIVRGDSDPRSTADLIRRAVRSADSSAVVEQVVRLEDTVDGMISEERLLAILSTVFGGLAVLLAAIGLYGVMAYNMSRRRAEIGVRVALGATTGDIGRAVAAECLKMVAGGLLAGTLATLALTRLVRSMMFGLSASDPLAIAGSVCFLVAVAAIAAAVPAWRASHLDPIAALRYE